jgi:hypothetical protein
MTKIFYQDEEIIFKTTFYNDPEKTDTVDPTTVVLELQKPNGAVINPTVSLDGARPLNEGKYIATYVAVDYGLLDWRWITTTPRIVRQGTINVERKSTA